jgi:hypothetical protein
MRPFIFTAFALAGMLLSHVEASRAEITTAIPFFGDFSEGWESFPNNRVGPNPINVLPEPVSIMAGNATMTSAGSLIAGSGNGLSIYEPDGGAPTFFGTSGRAQVADGDKGLAVASSLPVGNVIFTTPVQSFGAYWGAITGTFFSGTSSERTIDPSTVTVRFFDAANNLIGTENFDYSHSSTGDGGLDWHGWTSSTPFSRVSFETEFGFVAFDGLQADPSAIAPVPEPSAIMLWGVLSFAGAPLILRRQRKTSGQAA